MTPTTGLLLGIDVGTTNVKCALYDVSARLVALRTRPTRSAVSSDGLDVEAVWGLVEAASSEALQAARAAGPISVQGIAVASVGCVPVALDAAGRPVRLQPSQRDRIDAMERVGTGVSPAEYTAITGYPLEPETAIWGLAAGAAPDIARVRAVLSVADYIAYRLTGRCERERSTARSYGLWDYPHATWWRPGLAAIGLDQEAFGQPILSGTPIGTLRPAVAEALGLPRATPVATGGHDYLAAALAANVRPGPAVLNVSGTVEIMASLHRDAAATPGDGTYRAIKDSHVAAETYSTMIEAVGAGHVEAIGRTAPPGWPGGRINLEAAFRVLDRGAAADPVTSVLYIPARFGEFQPAAGPSPGTFLGVGPDTTEAGLLRAVIEGVCFTSLGMLTRQRELFGGAEVTVTMVGGGTRSRAWRQAKADILATPIRVPRTDEASALGAALLAGIGAGVYRDADEAAAVAADLGADVVDPDPARSGRYQERLQATYLPAARALAGTAATESVRLAPRREQDRR